MKIYTSYNRNPEIYTVPNAMYINIALWPPEGWKYFSLPELAPTAEILKEYKEVGNWEKYVKEYKEKVLAQLDPAEVLWRITRSAERLHAEVVFLLCFEGKGKNCHRHLVASWLDPTIIEY